MADRYAFKGIRSMNDFLEEINGVPVNCKAGKAPDHDPLFQIKDGVLTYESDVPVSIALLEGMIEEYVIKGELVAG